MNDYENSRGESSPELPDDLDHVLTTTADVESAGRSCLVIIAMAIIIVGLLGVWVVYTTS